MMDGKIPKKAKDRTGERHGRLVFLKYVKSSKDRNAIWLCQCDCGNRPLISNKSITGKKAVKSCGCLKKENHLKAVALPKGEAAKNYIYAVYKRAAKSRDLSFNIDKTEFLKLTQKECFYCGESPKNVYHNRKSTGGFIYNGIDRINNDLGYVKDNVVSCCKICNFAKRDLSKQEFEEWIFRVYHKTMGDNGVIETLTETIKNNSLSKVLNKESHGL